MKIIVFSVLVACVYGAAVDLASCPQGCTCEEAPLRDAPFVLAWMTTWGEEDLPRMHPNDVRDGESQVSGGTAESAGVNVDIIGIHATCALMADTNFTHLTHSLPSDTMVLTVLQSGGGGLVVVEAKHLQPLKNLRALHLQGYARKHTTQVSGYFPNTVAGMVAQKEAAIAAAAEEFGEGELHMSISEDTLNPLRKLQLLDLQYVRLVAGFWEAGTRSRREVEPIESDTLLDLPMPHFLSLIHKLQEANIEIPPEILDMVPSEDAYPEVEVVMLDDEPEVVSYEVLQAGGGEDLLLAPFLAQRQLRYLRVAHARLDRVGRELLRGLGKLHTLTLEHNNIKVLPSDMFEATPHLQHLSLAHNNLLAIDSNSLTGLNKLVTLDLDQNQIEQLGPNSFPSLPKLATLRLLANPLTHIFPFTFNNLNATETLLMGSRFVSAEVHEDTFSTLSSLTKLQLDNTTLSSLSNALLSGMPHLRHLTLHGSIPYINYDAFTDTPLLRSLTLSHCQLDQLSQDAFYGLRELRYLDLSHNKLTLLHPGTFDHLVSLRELYLHSNQLSTLPPAIFHRLPVKLVQLHRNPWDCTCRLLQLPPTLTNKVRQQGYTICRWHEKTGTVCVVPDPVPVRFDSRVAPLCTTPRSYRHLDVFHAAARQLKCPRSVWDPRFTHEHSPVTSRSEAPSESPNPSTGENNANRRAQSPTNGRESEGLPVLEESEWHQFMAFTPPPIPVRDIIEIYKAEVPQELWVDSDEDLEEEEEEEDFGGVIEERREEEDYRDVVEAQVNYLQYDDDIETGETEERSDGITANQEEMDNNLSVIPEINRTGITGDSNVSTGQSTNQNRVAYLQEKERIKAEMEEEERRRQEDLMSQKQEYWRNRAEEKRREKERREEESRRIMEEKVAQMEAFLQQMARTSE